MTALARAEERAERLVLVDGLVVRFGEIEAVAGVSFYVGGGFLPVLWAVKLPDACC